MALRSSKLSGRKEPAKRTRIQEQKEKLILEAALEVFSRFGFRGSTIDQVAQEAGMSKPNLLYYFPSKEAMHQKLIEMILDTWLAPLRKLDGEGDPLTEIRSYIRRKLTLSQEYPRQSKLFANEILQGAPRIQNEMADLKHEVDEKVKIFEKWMDEGKLARVDPYHLIFSIWSTTQHYADFDIQVCAILGQGQCGPERFEAAARYLDHLFVNGLRPSSDHQH